MVARMRERIDRKAMQRARTRVRLFPEFRRVLLESQDAMRAIPEATLSRYVKGELPSTLVWFIEFPDLLFALFKDVQGMTDDDRNEFVKSLEVRSKLRRAKEAERAKARNTTDQPKRSLLDANDGIRFRQGD